MRRSLLLLSLSFCACGVDLVVGQIDPAEVDVASSDSSTDGNDEAIGLASSDVSNDASCPSVPSWFVTPWCHGPTGMGCAETTREAARSIGATCAPCDFPFRYAADSGAVAVGRCRYNTTVPDGEYVFDWFCCSP
jgi:hypothetical protein